ncbi:hypothetical protein [Nocardia amikacinitolerans]|uniref:hypothetical protein n=1 Tax=Nocardia amikacinitolerans TaxID=756689 RepID=UPI0020A24943|nr:hypothetical protein [Nocardia amikacinitolerans]
MLPQKTSQRILLMLSSMVLVEAITGELKITQPREIALYARPFETLASQAVTGKASRALVGAALDRWREKSQE